MKMTFIAIHSNFLGFISFCSFVLFCVCPAVLYFLLQVSFLVDEGVSPVLLQLLSCALCGSKVLASSASSSFSGSGSGSTGQTGGSQTSQSKSSSKKSKKEDKEKDKDGGSIISVFQFSNVFTSTVNISFIRKVNRISKVIHGGC